MKLSRLLGALGLLAVSLWILNWVLHPKPLDSVALPPYGLGLAFAEAAAKAANEQGQVAVICQPTDSVQFHAQWEGFQKGLRQHKNMKLGPVKNLDLNEVGMGCISFNKFSESVQAQTQATVIVSFVPVSSFTEEQIQQLPQPGPKLVLMGLNERDVRRGLESGVLQAAVMPRIPDSLPSADIKTARQWFDYYYVMVTN